jgi:hypothetical protein
MPRYITILGTSHDLQGAEKRKSSVNDPTFSEAIEFLLSGKDFVFEKASGCGPTIAEKSAHEKLRPGHYLHVDPSRANRERYGIGDTGGQPIPIDFLHPVDGYLCPEYDLEQEKRENLWLYQIEGKNFTCGWRIVISPIIPHDSPPCYHSSMRHLVVLFIHLIAVLAQLFQPGGVRSLVAESLLLKHQLLIVNRSRQRSPTLSS